MACSVSRHVFEKCLAVVEETAARCHVVMSLRQG
jgi:hypothetical protein